MKKYLLGVDGGNTKTDYLIYTTEGKYVDLLRTGTCSHENFPDGFDGMERVMREQLDKILSRNNIDVTDIAAGGFGLAGADFPWQIEELEKRVAAIGFSRFGVANDGILGIKAACEGGVGLCAVNGTGTVVIGADEKGETMQVGGVGALSGDSAGGSYIRDRIVAALYDFHYRCGPDSSMFPEVLKILGAQPADLRAVIGNYELLHRNMTAIIKAAATAAENSDSTACKIFDHIGESIGKSAAGCIRKLSFSSSRPIEIVQVGSIWFKIPYPGMNDTFLKTTQSLSGKTCRIVKLNAPAAAGGILWAKELAHNAPPPRSFRDGVLKLVI
ncbi:MAG: N-acetylglucosamine kinase [Defluviitaleaceae bacterium]|nr:N-acetylglucosamine kinase [Defluviitaleaceae bacterium]MCL2263047.1 N-acetylglucosamine kinase [Defluviitaleaceae bacterium]